MPARLVLSRTQVRSAQAVEVGRGAEGIPPCERASRRQELAHRGRRVRFAK